MDELLTQNDLDALYEEILAESNKPSETKKGEAEDLGGSEFLTQDQIDQLLKAFQND